MKVLVTGATGYVGGRLVPLLLDEGHTVRTTTHRARPGPWWWADAVETVPMDALDPQQVEAACEGVDAVYYLLHGLDRPDFVEQDRRAAQNLVAAVEKHRVERVVYLSGIVPPVPEERLSDHIASRLEVERVLTDSSATVISLRAAIVIGSGSASFEILRQVSERLLLQPLPLWMDSAVQPVAVVDVLECLLGALTLDSDSLHLDVGGPEQLSYARLLQAYAQIAGRLRPQLVLPYLRDPLVGRLVGALTDVPTPVVRSLVQSLRHDMVCADDSFVPLLLPPGHRLVGVRPAIERALAAPQDDPPDADPMGPMPQDPAWSRDGGARPVTSALLELAQSLLPDR
ncbi:NAD(P)H-binding protein [Luteipulveratus sp. YIM 133132]|uniref:NAD(P)H-binding protein n=1 Tax=Luteipulveratus flavus TaxID=3031728 RepID=UPI0023B0B45C|nr:NAD(P)H-binding protein [Luteipulveratus sp. YIM 133132]MDE9364288.1 NAD(P)H-binding protein [Luteipulveratus sp. YIM 133132]